MYTVLNKNVGCFSSSCKCNYFKVKMISFLLESIWWFSCTFMTWIPFPVFLIVAPSLASGPKTPPQTYDPHSSKLNRRSESAAEVEASADRLKTISLSDSFFSLVLSPQKTHTGRCQNHAQISVLDSFRAHQPPAGQDMMKPNPFGSFRLVLVWTTSPDKRHWKEKIQTFKNQYYRVAKRNRNIKDPFQKSF